MIIYHLGPQLSVWIMQVSTFSSVLINRFRCNLQGNIIIEVILSPGVHKTMSQKLLHQNHKRESFKQGRQYVE